MKVGIIGGGGIVGASAGFALQLGGVVHEIVIVDVNADLADGHLIFVEENGPIGQHLIKNGPRVRENLALLVGTEVF